jgi:crotonobetainyl-CoA:carnitine CoA-transferase CaiB-like acyl-CoA transferase
LPQKTGNEHPNIAPYGDILYSSDDVPIMVACGTEKHFRDLLHVIKGEDLLANPQFENNQSRVLHRHILLDKLKGLFKKLPVDFIMDECMHKNIPVARINNIKEVMGLSRSMKLILEQDEEDGSVSKRIKSAIFEMTE